MEVGREDRGRAARVQGSSRATRPAAFGRSALGLSSSGRRPPVTLHPRETGNAEVAVRAARDSPTRPITFSGQGIESRNSRRWVHPDRLAAQSAGLRTGGPGWRPC